MSVNKSFLDRFTERFDDLDASSRQAYILRLARDRGFFEAVFNAVEEGIMVVDKSLHIRYHNRAADELLALPEDPGQLRVSQLLQGVDWKRILSEDEEEWSRFARQELEILYPERRFIHFYLVPLPEETSLAAVILRDVTESRERTSSEVEQETVKAVSPLRYLATKPKITIEVDRYIITGKILSLMKVQISAAVSPPIISAAT